MNVNAYRLYEQAAVLQPAALRPAVNSHVAHTDEAALARASQQGWVLLCPQGFTATWNGGPRAEDITIQMEGANASAETAGPPAFVQSQQGDGVLTFYPGYQFKTEQGAVLWLRGPINAPKDGVMPSENLIDAPFLPVTATLDWQFTAPQQTIRFAAGEPFATLLLYPKGNLEPLQVEVVQPETDEQAYVQRFQQLIDTPAVNDLFLRLGATPAAPTELTVTGTNRPQPVRKSWAAQLVNPPGVSCICPTYGRVELLEEAIYSFLQQDYPGPKELIVLNDYAKQTLIFDHPEVRIVNLANRYQSVGEKYKAAVGLASHDLIFVWHDDDIYLPHRLSYSVLQFEQNTTFFKADKAWFWNNGKLSGLEKNVFHGGSCWQRALYNKAQGYPAINNRYDVEFEQRCQSTALGGQRTLSIPPAETYYIYRWQGTNSYHLSGLGADGQEYQKVAAQVELKAMQGQIPQGEVRLNPCWRSDYTALVQAHLAASANGQAGAQAKNVEPADEIPFPPPYHVMPPPPPLPVARVQHLFQGHYPAKISVILPASNESVMLQRTVEQFVATLPANSEVIVVDNGSTDGCADFLDERPLENVHLIRSIEQLGVAGARNRGFDQARGEIVVFADAHLDLPERWWEPIAATLQRPEVGVVGAAIGVMGRPQHSPACGQRIAEASLRVQWLPYQGNDPYPVPTLGGGFMAMRHDTLKRAGAFDVGMPQWGSEDLEICVRYWLLGYEAWVAPSVIVAHYFRKSNPYKVEWGAVTHNLLRVALLHFSQERMARVIAALKNKSNFATAMAYAATSDVWEKRAEFAARRLRDDDWYFEKFADSCSV